MRELMLVTKWFSCVHAQSSLACPEARADVLLTSRDVDVCVVVARVHIIRIVLRGRIALSVAVERGGVVAAAFVGADLALGVRLAKVLDDAVAIGERKVSHRSPRHVGVTVNTRHLTRERAGGVALNARALLFVAVL
eukprot:6203473-Pleurochrysis_carterae.AAC.2